MASKVLFIVEGEKIEKEIVENLQKTILKEIKVEAICSFGNNIYELYEKMMSSKYLNVIELINEIKTKDYISDEFTDIILIFDYDGHAPKADDCKIIKMLRHFNNSTKNGKLYINYPMSESIKMLSLKEEALFYDIRKGSKFKEFVDKNRDNKLNDVSKYNFETWKEIIKMNVLKVNNYLLKEDKKEDSKSKTLEKIRLELKRGLRIFLRQKKKYINSQEKILILNSFPIFICNFVKKSYLKKLVGSNFINYKM